MPINMPDNMVPEDTAYWEAEYAGGQKVRENEVRYAALDRGRITRFRIFYQGEVVFETWPPPGATGHNLVFRRRTSIIESTRTVNIILGWAPLGPAYVINLADGTFRVIEEGFKHGDSELYPPIPMPGEPAELFRRNP